MATLSWEPVHPSKSPFNGVDPKEVQFTPSGGYDGLSVSCYHFGLNVMLDLEFPFGETKGNTNVQYFMLEVAAYEAGVHSAEIISGRLFFKRRGVGFRVGVASWDVEFTAAASLAAVAASGSVKSAKTNIDVQAFGGDAIESLKIFERLHTMDGLSPETLRAIAMAGEDVADVLGSGEELQPKDLQVANVEVGVTEGWPEVAYSMQFAVESIYRGKSLLKAYRDFINHDDKEQRKLFNSLLPRAAYVDFGLINENQDPTEEDKKEAGLILVLGR